MNNGWCLRLLRDDEAGALHRLSVACFGDRANSEAFIRQRYVRSGEPQAFTVVAEADGQIIGSQTVTLLPFLVDGHDEHVGMFTDGMTHPEYRRRGIFRDVVREAERRAFESGACALFTMPNDESLPGFVSNPMWTVLPDRKLLVRPLDITGFLRDRGWPGIAARVTGVIPDWWYARKRHQTGEEITSLSGIADDLDRLARHGAKVIGGVACIRDHDFLRWRFIENATWQYRYFIKRERGAVSAYAITITERRLGSTVAYIVDALFNDDSDALVQLIGHVGRVLRADGVRLLGAIVAAPALEQVLRRAGLRHVPRRLSPRGFHSAVAVNPDRPDVQPVCLREDAWFFTLADFDTI